MKCDKCYWIFKKVRRISTLPNNVKLFYNFLHYALVTDFEKDLDSISWSFIYKVLEFFGFSEYVID